MEKVNYTKKKKNGRENQNKYGQISREKNI